MTTTEKIEGIANKAADNKLLAVTARGAILLAVSVGFPAGIWMVTSTVSHGSSIVLLQTADTDHKRRIERLEGIADRLPEDDRRLRDRIAAIETAAARVETQAQALLRALDEMRRERSAYPPAPPAR